MSRKIERAVSDVAGLVKAGLIAEAVGVALAPVEDAFSVRLTPEVLGQISKASLEDPIFAQYVPQVHELETRSDELADPIGDDAHEKVRGVVHRYPDRVLLKPTQTCAVYCRFCFRREKVGGGAPGLSASELDSALAYIAGHPEINEVILTGGDPLVLSARRLRDIVERLVAIPHISLLRFHTRVPVVEPERITGELLKAMKVHPASHVVIHVNHCDELSAPVAKALARTVDAGIPVLSQSVLLKGLNDDADTLAALFGKLVSLRVKPYYLHHLDRARGTSHFRVSIGRGQELMAQLRGRISGFSLPTYVLDVPGGFGKVPVNASYVNVKAPGHYEITDPWGGKHSYFES